MKQCPKCGFKPPSDIQFCPKDGARLIYASDMEQTIVTPPFPGFQSPNQQVQPVCSNCGTPQVGNSGFCPRCGAASRPPASQFESPRADRDSSMFSQSPASEREGSVAGRFATKPIAIAAGSILAVILVVVGAVYISGRSHPLEGDIDRAIKAGELAGSNSSAIALYKKMKDDGASASLLSKYEERISPLVEKKTSELIDSAYEVGQVNREPKEWADAAEMLEWSSSLSPQNTKLRARAEFCRGRSYSLQGDFGEAIKRLEVAEGLDRQWALLKHEIGRAYHGSKDYSTARTWFQKAKDLDPKWPMPPNSIGKTYFDQKKYADAQPYFEKAVELSPDWATPHAWLATIHKNLKWYQAAIDEFDKVLAPGAIGTWEMNLEDIKKQRRTVQALLQKQQEEEYYFEGE